MKADLIEKLKYIIICADRAIKQEKGEMERLGSWYINQELDEISRSIEKARVIHNDRQHEMKFNEDEHA